MRMLFVGHSKVGTTAEQRSRALQSLGFQLTALAEDSFSEPHWCVRAVQRRIYLRGLPVRYSEPNGFNAAILEAAGQVRPEVLWLEKGIYVRRCTLQKIATEFPGCHVIGFSPDDMGGRHNR